MPPSPTLPMAFDGSPVESPELSTSTVPTSTLGHSMPSSLSRSPRDKELRKILDYSYTDRLSKLTSSLNGVSADLTLPIDETLAVLARYLQTEGFHPLLLSVPISSEERTRAIQCLPAETDLGAISNMDDAARRAALPPTLGQLEINGIMREVRFMATMNATYYREDKQWLLYAQGNKVPSSARTSGSFEASMLEYLQAMEGCSFWQAWIEANKYDTTRFPTSWLSLMVIVFTYKLQLLFSEDTNALRLVHRFFFHRETDPAFSYETKTPLPELVQQFAAVSAGSNNERFTRTVATSVMSQQRSNAPGPFLVTALATFSRGRQLITRYTPAEWLTQIYLFHLEFLESCIQENTPPAFQRFAEELRSGRLDTLAKIDQAYAEFAKLVLSNHSGLKISLQQSSAPSLYRAIGALLPKREA